MTAMKCEVQCDPPVTPWLYMEKESVDTVLCTLPQDQAAQKQQACCLHGLRVP